MSLALTSALTLTLTLTSGLTSALNTAPRGVFLLAFDSSPFTNYWHRLVDPTFRGLYQANAFDLAIMLPYFLVMVVLATYGIHRYVLVYNFYKNRKNVPGPAPEITAWPKVTVQLPIYNERYVTERLVEAVAQFDYPRELLQIQVLDDSTDETTAIARNCVERYHALGVPIELHPSRQSRRLQGRRAAGRAENRDRRIRGDFRCGFYSARRFSAPHRSVFHRLEARDGADALELHQSQLFGAHRSGSDPPRRALCHRALVALPQRPVLQFQRHGGHLAPQSDRGCGRLAARHAHRGHRPFLSRADSRLAIPLFARDRLPLRTARGDERLQVAAGALGQGLDADGKENPAAGDARRCSHGGEGRGVFPSDGQHQLSADDFHVDDFAAGDDRAVLSGMVSGAGDRSAAVSGVDLLDFVVLSRGRARPLSQNLEAHVLVFAVRDGGGHRNRGAQRGRGARGDRGQKIRIRAHAEIPRGSRRQGSRRRGSRRAITRARAGCRTPRCCSGFISQQALSTPFKTKITPPRLFCFCLCGATSTPA